MLKFDNLWLADTHGPLIVGGVDVPIRPVKYWDVVGEGEIVGRQGGRPIVCTIIVHDGFTTFAKFQKQIDKMRKKQGANGVLEESGDLKQKFSDVTFHGYEPIPLGGQDEPGPLLDVGALRRANGSLDNGYFAAYMLRFRQLLVN
jgi:hypothetical protein